MLNMSPATLLKPEPGMLSKYLKWRHQEAHLMFAVWLGKVARMTGRHWHLISLGGSGSWIYEFSHINLHFIKEVQEVWWVIQASYLTGWYLHVLFGIGNTEEKEDLMNKLKDCHYCILHMDWFHINLWFMFMHFVEIGRWWNTFGMKIREKFRF